MHILGFRVDEVTLEDAAQRMLAWAQSADSRGAGSTRIVVTVNPEILMAARRDPVLAEILAQAAMVVPDGIGVVLASRLAGRPVPERVPGVDLLMVLLERCAGLGLRPFLLGARPEIIERAVRKVKQKFPRLELAGWHDGYFRMDDPGPVRQVAASGAHLLFVGMGAERELRWLYENRHAINVPVAMGVGGSFDVISGAIPRAPLWMQRCHLEWFYRLVIEPRRWRRQLAIPQFVWAVLVEQLLRRPAGG